MIKNFPRLWRGKQISIIIFIIRGDNMNVVIIGATKGLGFELTSKFLKEGHRVVGGILERETPAALLELSSRYGENLMIIHADVRDEDEIIAGAQKSTGFLGEIDALCNVAGILLPGDRVNEIHKCDISELRMTFEVNTFGAIIVAKAYCPVIKKGGAILTVTSEGVGMYNCGTWVPCYGLSKLAATKISGLFNAAIEDVDFYSIHPGRMNTEMGRTTAQIEASETADGIYKLITIQTPMSRDCWYIDYNGNPMPT
jgi:NAD(P)-dependent dehydrogenase (short-subunit alcohol dehydrogenase family)